MIYRIVAQGVSDYLEKAGEIRSYAEAVSWFSSLPPIWQMGLGACLVGLALAAFILVIGSIIR